MIIRRDHTLGSEEAKRRVEKVAAEIGSQFNLKSGWEGEDLRFYGSGVDGHIAVDDDSVEVRVKLGFALLMLREPIRIAIENSIDEYIDD